MTPAPLNDDTRTFQLLRQVKGGGLNDDELARLHLAESDTTGHKAAILLVDDYDEIRVMMTQMLCSLGYQNLAEAADGEAALALLCQRQFDLVILDIEMPVLDGYSVLKALKQDPLRRHIPVIVASGLQDLSAVVRCIELGAEDFLPKPVNTVLLGARIGASLERKRLRDLEQLRLLELRREKQRLEMEQEKSERLLLNVLPPPIAERLKQGEHTIAERYADVSVLFADLVDFTSLLSHTSPEESVDLLNDLFSRFDRIAEQLGLEKIKTIGDCYLVVGGLPRRHDNHAGAMAEMALAMLDALDALNRERGTKLSVRIGMHTGPVVAGVIGRKKFAYDLWGATVNLASRMQSEGLPNRVHLTDDMRQLLGDKYAFTERGTILCKGLGEVSTCLLDGRKTGRPPIG